MAKYGKKIAGKILELIKADTYTVAEICRQVGISQRTFYLWMDEYPEFAESVERAKDERMEFFVMEAKKSLLKKIQGYEVMETHVATVPDKKSGKPIIKEQKNVKKHIQPDTSAIIFTLTNGDPNNWRNRQTTEITGKDGSNLIPQKLSVDEAKELISKLEDEY
jgi:transposase-like protein